MSRLAKSTWVFLGLCLTLAICVPGHGVLIGTRLETHSHKGTHADRTYIFNRSVRVCRYLYPSGIVERRTDWDEAGTACAFFGSS